MLIVMELFQLLDLLYNTGNGVCVVGVESGRSIALTKCINVISKENCSKIIVSSTMYGKCRVISYHICSPLFISKVTH